MKSMGDITKTLTGRSYLKAVQGTLDPTEVRDRLSRWTPRSCGAGTCQPGMHTGPLALEASKEGHLLTGQGPRAILGTWGRQEFIQIYRS